MTHNILDICSLDDYVAKEENSLSFKVTDRPNKATNSEERN